ncbi:DUF6970 domain-containing protein [Pontibacter litorisediminis]|uniref:DUF6970 domain-containing protein n=1 Tax=Pontibacter litorisediminis TaxID=1846260 RepID=UPI0023EE122A|nr:hypothetical protein [Pontibacter litorisediminis]
MRKNRHSLLARVSVWVAALAVAITVTACSPGSSSTAAAATQENPSWLTKLIGELKLEEPSNPPAKIYRYTYLGQEVYYLTGRCCDVPGQLFDAQGNILCEPDGGITGRGDGRCPDFFEQRHNETLVWEDNRES